MKISQTIIDFIEKSIQIGDLNSVDKFYAQNKLLALLKEKEIERVKPSAVLPENRLDLLDQLVDYAVHKKLIEDYPSSKDVFEAEIMDIVTPVPSIVNKLFWEEYQNNPQKATDSFYEMSKRNNYIKTREIRQNIEFTHETDFGAIELTINLSKPEKSSKEIALAKENKSNYPMNVLSIENEGYLGHMAHPGRTNHRVVRMDLHEDKWGFQYSPYSYYNEHSIFLSIEHRPMDVGIQAIKNLLEIITVLPHYFVGSNAGLPIVGGSILAQDHYQGGRHRFALDEAEIVHEFSIEKTPNVTAGIVRWPMSTIRLSGGNKDEIVEAAQVIMDNWYRYSNKEVDIFSETDGTPHNAITPIARREEKLYVLDLVLRNNRTSKEFPDGIFHPHKNVQHIKKENIGLIEVLGLAVLPPRLKEELQDVRNYLLNQSGRTAEVHQSWAEELKEKYPEVNEETVDAVIKQEVGEVFLQVLKDAGVFKTDDKGKNAFIEFVNQIK